MTRKHFPLDDFETLRRKAKQQLAKHPPQIPDLADDPMRLLEELQIQYIELQMQNDQLREAQNQLAETTESYEQLYQKYQILFDFAPIGYLLVNRQGAIREANLTAATLLKTPRNQLAGRPLAAFVHAEAQDRYFLEVLRRIEEKLPCSTSIDMVAADGRCFPAHIQSQPNDSAVNGVNGTRLAFVDISREMALHRDLSLINTCLEIAAQATGLYPLLDKFAAAIQSYAACEAVGIRLLQSNGRIPYRSCQGFSQHFLESASQLVLGTDQGMCMDVMTERTSVDKPCFTAWGSFFTNASSQWLAAAPTDRSEATCHACHAEGYESLALVPVRCNQRIAGLIHVADQRENRLLPDVLHMIESAAQRLGTSMERLNIQAELDRTVDDLRHLTIKLLQAQEDEQRRIAMELHDQTGQDLNVLKLRAIQLHSHLLEEEPDMAGKCHNLELFIDKIIEDVRRLSHGLSPAALDVLGLSAAVNAMLADYADHMDWDITSEVDALEEITELTVQIAVYRIIQEALQNVYKHANAKTVAVRAYRQADGLVIEISDDGKGFDYSSIQRGENQPRGLGLSAMQLRARMIGGRLEYASLPGEGAEIRLELPLNCLKELS